MFVLSRAHYETRANKKWRQINELMSEPVIDKKLGRSPEILRQQNFCERLKVPIQKVRALFDAVYLVLFNYDGCTMPLTRHQPHPCGSMFLSR